jgi:hypothetical protein
MVSESFQTNKNKKTTGRFPKKGFASVYLISRFKRSQVSYFMKNITESAVVLIRL